MQFDYIICKEPSGIGCKKQIIVGKFNWLPKVELRGRILNIHRIFGNIKEQNNSSIEESSGIAIISRGENRKHESTLNDHMLFGHILRRELNILSNNRIVIGSNKVCKYLNSLIDTTSHSLEDAIEEMKNHFWLKNDCSEYSQSKDDIEVLNSGLKHIGWISIIDIERNIDDIYKYKIYYTKEGIRIAKPGQIIWRESIIGIANSEDRALSEKAYYEDIGLAEIQRITRGVYKRDWFKCIIPSYLAYEKG